MKNPEEYTQLLAQFVEENHHAVKVEGNREDWVAFTMAAFALELPVEVRNGKKAGAGFIYLVRKD